MTDIERLACSISYEHNLLKLAEESGELLQAIVKAYEKDNQKTRQAVVEEMVDVMICMDAVRCILRIDEAMITDMRHHKMVRALQRLCDE